MVTIVELCCISYAFFTRLYFSSVQTVLISCAFFLSRHAWSFPRFRHRFLSLSDSYLQAGPVRERTGNRSGTCCPRFTVATLVGLKYASVASCCCVVSSKVLPRYLSLTRDRKRVLHFAIKEKNRRFVTLYVIANSFLLSPRLEILSYLLRLLLMCYSYYY